MLFFKKCYQYSVPDYFVKGFLFLGITRPQSRCILLLWGFLLFLDSVEQINFSAKLDREEGKAERSEDNSDVCEWQITKQQHHHIDVQRAMTCIRHIYSDFWSSIFLLQHILHQGTLPRDSRWRTGSGSETWASVFTTKERDNQ